jgi:hypothetical protein
MKRRALLARTSLFFLLAPLFAGVAAGCTLLNSFDDVVPQRPEPDAGTPGPPVLDANAPPDTSLPPGAVDAGVDSTVPVDGGGPDVEVDAGPRGVIVIGGSIDSDGGRQPVLTALDPATGSELVNARMPMLVADVLYDGTRDLWYVFESGGAAVFPLPTDPFYLHTFSLEPVSGTWTELGKIAIPPGLSFSTTSVLSERVSYIAYGQGAPDASDDASDDAATDGGTSIPAAFGLVTLDTTDPKAVTVASVVPLASSPAAVIGTRTPVNPAGGFATLGASVKGFAQLTPVLVPATDPPQVEAAITGTAATGGSTGFAAVTTSGASEVAVVTRGFGAPSTPATLQIFNPAEGDPTQALVGAGTFAFTDGNIKAPAFDPCTQTLFVIGTNADLSVHAVSIASVALPDADGGIPPLPATAAPTGHSGQSVYFEPYTSTVLVPFSQGQNFTLTAFTLTGSAGAPALILREAPRWSPPPELRPAFVATRAPVPAFCAGALGDH